ncbi:cytochrome c oxidase assembly protein [Gracilibacillus xinjiangensis]|uniref:Cytochrome c oxidase assembly protein n=1 Tax=Gracilibacillus xinjiangensis TaxID=1193282 RepID=A0ABV8WSR4_9BACI
MDNHHLQHADTFLFELVIGIILIMALSLYIGAAILSNRRRHLRRWPFIRYVFWISGIICVGLSMIGPLANRAHIDFNAHMAGHLLLGMLAPLLLVLAAPVTLLLRTLHVSAARRLTVLLRSWPLRLISHPVVASVLNIGGLWVLYTTELYRMMQHNFLLHLVIHLHVFLAGYVFTGSILYIEPIAHRFSFVYRSVVLVLALAGHAILSKYIYIEPPAGVTKTQAETGGMLMYYGGDLIDIVLIFILCMQWYKFTRPQAALSLSKSCT